MFWGSPIPKNLIAEEIKDKIEIKKEKNPIHHQKTHHQKSKKEKMVCQKLRAEEKNVK